MAALSKHAASFPLVFRLLPHPSILLIGKQQFRLPSTIWKPPGKLQSYPPLAFFVSLFGAYGRIPVFCFRVLFRFSIARQMRPLPRYTLPITPPKTFTGVSSTVSICPILDKTKHIQAKYRNSLKIAPAQICFAPYPRYPQNVLGRFRKSKNACDFEKIQN